MRRIAIALVFLMVSAASDAQAGPLRRMASRMSRGPAGRTSAARAPAADTSSCAAVAAHMAATGRMDHYGNPTRTYEGVGFSTSSAQDALDRCCYSRSGMVVVDSSVARGAGGWYAIKRYSPN